MAGMSQPQEVHIGAIDSNGGSTAWPNNSTPLVVVATSTDGAPSNAADSTQSFITMADLIAFLDKERSRHGTIPFQFVYDPPYPKEILSNMKVLYSRNMMGRRAVLWSTSHAGDRDLCLCEFSKSFSDRAYTWYTTLLSDSICSWDEMVE
ncbi:hypothetical protein SLA2020_010080 [Shorea laevis]